jgi:hypothetical protein
MERPQEWRDWEWSWYLLGQWVWVVGYFLLEVISVLGMLLVLLGIGWGVISTIKSFF